MNPEPNPPGEPLPQKGAEHARDPRGRALEQAIVAFGHRQRATRRLAQIAIGVAVLAFAASIWVDYRSKDRVQAIRRLSAEVEDLRGELRRVKTERPRLPVRRIRPATGDGDPIDRLPEFDEPLDLSALRKRLAVVEAKSQSNGQDLTSGLVEWGTETKSYVDRSITTAAEERRREASQELALVWARIRQIELRLPR